MYSCLTAFFQIRESSGAPRRAVLRPVCRCVWSRWLEAGRRLSGGLHLRECRQRARAVQGGTGGRSCRRSARWHGLRRQEGPPAARSTPVAPHLVWARMLSPGNFRPSSLSRIQTAPPALRSLTRQPRSACERRVGVSAAHGAGAVSPEDAQKRCAGMISLDPLHHA